MTDDDELLMRCDSLLSLIRYREWIGLSDQTVRDLDELIGPLRKRTNAIRPVVAVGGDSDDQ